MVTTRSKTQANVSSMVLQNQVDDGNSDHNESDVEPVKPPPKKQRKSSASASKSNAIIRRKRGILAGLMNMPLDIFAEVTAHLDPLDLLHLARTSKRLRSIMMSKTARMLWIESRKNVPASSSGRKFPDGSGGLSEPAYASLVFEKSCLACGRNNANRVYFSSYLRLCAKCDSENVMLKGRDQFSLLCKIPSSTPKTIIRAMYALLPKNDAGFFVPSMAQSMYRQMREKKKEGPVRLMVYLTEQLQMSTGAFKHGCELERWHEEYLEDQVQKRKDVANEREERICERLLEAGWLPQDFPTLSDDTEDLKAFQKIVRQSKSLTERTWENMQPKLHEILRSVKAMRKRKADLQQRRKEIEALIAAFLATETTPETLPSYPTEQDILRMPSTIILLGETVSESHISPEKWSSHVESLREDIQQYQRETRREFASKVRTRLVSLATKDCQEDPRYSYLREAAVGVTLDPTDVEDDAANLAFLTKDPSRMSFTSLSDVGKPYLAALEDYRAQRIADEDLLFMDDSYSPAMWIGCKIEEPEKFELVDGIWT